MLLLVPLNGNDAKLVLFTLLTMLVFEILAWNAPVRISDFLESGLITEKYIRFAFDAEIVEQLFESDVGRLAHNKVIKRKTKDFDMCIPDF